MVVVTVQGAPNGELLTGLLYIWITHSIAAGTTLVSIVIAFLGKQGDIQGLTMD
jgi:hypothetical protein